MNMKENSESINQSPDYLRGLSDGLKEGYIAAMEQLHFLSQQQQSIQIKIKISPEKLQELKTAINDIPMPIELIGGANNA